MALPDTTRPGLVLLCVTLIQFGCDRTDKLVMGEVEKETLNMRAHAVGNVELEVSVAGPQLSAHGEKQFNSYCAACHQRGGQGTEGRVPPLDGSPWVAGSENRLVRIVLNGLRGPIEIHGEIYNLEMPAFRMLFQDDDIASVLTYVRQRYGAPSARITSETVTRVREETRDRTSYWTVEELLKIP